MARPAPSARASSAAAHPTRSLWGGERLSNFSNDAELFIASTFYGKRAATWTSSNAKGHRYDYVLASPAWLELATGSHVAEDIDMSTTDRAYHSPVVLTVKGFPAAPDKVISVASKCAIPRHACTALAGSHALHSQLRNPPVHAMPDGINVRARSTTEWWLETAQGHAPPPTAPAQRQDWLSSDTWDAVRANTDTWRELRQRLKAALFVCLAPCFDAWVQEAEASLGQPHRQPFLTLAPDGIHVRIAVLTWRARQMPRVVSSFTRRDKRAWQEQQAISARDAAEVGDSTALFAMVGRFRAKVRTKKAKRLRAVFSKTGNCSSGPRNPRKGSSDMLAP